MEFENWSAYPCSGAVVYTFTPGERALDLKTMRHVLGHSSLECMKDRTA